MSDKNITYEDKPCNNEPEYAIRICLTFLDILFTPFDVHLFRGTC